MNSKRISLRFNLDSPEDLAAWDYLHTLKADSINKEIIAIINSARQNRDLRDLLRQTISVALQGMSLQPVEKQEITESDIAALDFGNIVRKSGLKRMKNGSIAMKSAFVERNRPDPRGLLLRSLIHINRLHEPQSRKALRRRRASLHPNGKRSLKSKTLFCRGRMSTSRTPSEKQHPPVVKSGRTLYAESETKPSKQRSGRNTRLSSPPVLPERRP